MTAEKKAAKRAAWLSTPIARVEKPLRYIREATIIEEKDENGKFTVRDHPIYTAAKALSADGFYGTRVQEIARGIFIQRSIV